MVVLLKSTIKYLAKTVERPLAEGFDNELPERRMHSSTSDEPLAITLVTSVNKQCGIATYSEFLAQELQKTTKLHVTGVPKNIRSSFFKTLGYWVRHSHDLVHVQFEYGIFPSLKLGKKTLTAFAAFPFYYGLALTKRRVVTTMHEPRKIIAAGGKSGLRYTKALDKLIFSVSDIIIVHTQESKQLLQTVYGVKVSKLRVIPHGSYEQPKFTDKQDAKAQFGLAGKTVVTILGFVTPKKGHDLVIPLLPKLDRNVQVVIAGGPQNAEDARYLEKLKEMAEEYHCTDRVTFTGYLPDLTAILNATDVAVLPYRNVTDSGVLHLLVAYRVPTVASDLEAFREVYGEYGCLDLFRAGDAEDLYFKLQALLSDTKKQDLLKAKCGDMWNATKWSTIAQRHIEIYREVLSDDT